MKFAAFIGALALLSTQAAAQTVHLLTDGDGGASPITTPGLPGFLPIPPQSASVSGVGIKPSPITVNPFQKTARQAVELKRAHEICLSRFWITGHPCSGTQCASVYTIPHWSVPECEGIVESWKASGAPEADKAAAEKAEREDREFVERVAKELSK